MPVPAPTMRLPRIAQFHAGLGGNADKRLPPAMIDNNQVFQRDVVGKRAYPRRTHRIGQLAVSVEQQIAQLQVGGIDNVDGIAPRAGPTDAPAGCRRHG